MVEVLKQEEHIIEGIFWEIVLARRGRGYPWIRLFTENIRSNARALKDHIVGSRLHHREFSKVKHM